MDRSDFAADGAEVGLYSSAAASETGWPESSAPEVIEWNGMLLVQSMRHWPYEHELAMPARVSPILAHFLFESWDRVKADCDVTRVGELKAMPQNREIRKRICEMASAAEGSDLGAAIERQRAWRIIDWKIRTSAAAFLELAGWGSYAEAFRDLPPIDGPSLPRGALTLFRKARHDTDTASTNALHGLRPFKRDLARVKGAGRSDGRIARLEGRFSVSSGLVRAVLKAFPRMEEQLEAQFLPRRAQKPLGQAVLAGAYASICIDYDPRIPAAKVSRVLDQLGDSSDALFDEIVAMGKSVPRA